MNLTSRLSSLHEFLSRHWTRIKLQIREMLEARSEAASLTAPLMAAIGIDYLVTLTLFPGIESEVISCSLRTWMPVILMALFNLSDFIGKILSSLLYATPPWKLFGFSTLRIFLIPAFCFCVSPRHDPYLRSEFFSMTLAVILGLSNGICGSLPMILAPAKVPGRLKEITGNLMTLSYSIGLTLGSLMAYLVDYGLGASLTNYEIGRLCNYNVVSVASNINLIAGQSVINPNLINFSNNFTREYLIKAIQNQSLVDVSRINDNSSTL